MDVIELLKQEGMIVLSPREARAIVDALQSVMAQREQIAALEQKLSLANAINKTNESTMHRLREEAEDHRAAATHVHEAYRIQEAYMGAVQALFGDQAHKECLDKAGDILANTCSNDEYWLDSERV